MADTEDTQQDGATPSGEEEKSSSGELESLVKFAEDYADRKHATLDRKISEQEKAIKSLQTAAESKENQIKDLEAELADLEDGKELPRDAAEIAKVKRELRQQKRELERQTQTISQKEGELELRAKELVAIELKGKMTEIAEKHKIGLSELLSFEPSSEEEAVKYAERIANLKQTSQKVDSGTGDAPHTITTKQQLYADYASGRITTSEFQAKAKELNIRIH